MIETRFAENFAREWIDAWNSHDMSRILDHYSDDFEMSSPIISQVAREPSGRLKGKGPIGSYWTKALEMFPDLHFAHIATFVGVNTITLNFEWAGGLSAEVFMFGPDLKVTMAFAHHAVGV